MRIWQRVTAAALAGLLAACGGSDSDDDGGEPLPEPRAGISTDHIIASDLDGEAISFTVHEPSSFVEGQRYPLVLEGHGYGGSKVSAAERPAGGDAGSFGRLLDAGYGIVSIDQRGFGESGGTVRLFDPDVEAKDLVQIVDWAEENLGWLQYRDDNLVLGAIGGSYGGGYQHALLANDPGKRLDAIVPEITWHDLSYSLYSSEVFKSFWATVLFAGGAATGNQDPEIVQGIAQGLSLNMLDDEKVALLRKGAMSTYCAEDRIPEVDAMYWQSPGDTLFNLTETFKNYACVAARGGDVRLLTKNSGHDSALGGAAGEQCGKLGKVQAIVDWFDEKLKREANAADYIPQFCFHLDNSAEDAVVTGELPQVTETVQVPAQTLLAGALHLQNLSVPLLTAGPGGAVIAGVPTINLTVSPGAAGEVGDPIIFVALARRAAGTTTDVMLQPNQVRPFRGYYTAVDEELIAVSNRLAEGDELRLLISGGNTARYPKSASLLPTLVTIEATVGLPLLPGDLDAPPAN